MLSRDDLYDAHFAVFSALCKVTMGIERGKAAGLDVTIDQEHDLPILEKAYNIINSELNNYERSAEQIEKDVIEIMHKNHFV